MLEYFYRTDDQELFCGREEQLARLANALLAVHPVDMHLSGLRRIGKTMLIKEFIKRQLLNTTVLPVYINLEEIAETPEDFALKFIGWHVYWLQGKGESLPLPFLQLSGLYWEITDKAVRDAVQPLVRELEKARPDRQALLQACFAFPSELARITGRRVILFLDEFQEIAHLANFEQAKNILKLLRAAKDRSHQVAWCICGSIISEMDIIARTPESPLFNQFSHLSIPPYVREESESLILKHLPDCDHRIMGLLHHFSAGSPFYLSHLLRRLTLLGTRGDELTEGLVKRAFIAETLSPGGMIYSYCTYLYNISIQRAKGYGVLRSLLDNIAVSHEPMNQSELARRLKMTQGAVRSNLNELVAVGVIHERERRYHYTDPVLRYWVAYVQHGIEVSEFPGERDLLLLMEELDRKYQVAAAELGKSREETIRVLMRKFRGQEVTGSLFGMSGMVTLPQFTEVERFRSPDGRTEIDALGSGPQRWAVEVKWKTRAVGVKELTSFAERAGSLADRLWFVSRAGFTSDGRTYAREQGILISGQQQVERLIQELE
jgi:hypothetical protein